MNGKKIKIMRRCKNLSTDRAHVYNGKAVSGMQKCVCHHLGSRAELCLHTAAYDHCEIYLLLLSPMCCSWGVSIGVKSRDVQKDLLQSILTYLGVNYIFLSVFSPLFLFCAFALAVIHAVPCKLVAPGIALLAMSWLPLWWMLYALCSVYDKLSIVPS